jgi:hypothetical protein
MGLSILDAGTSNFFSATKAGFVFLSAPCAQRPGLIMPQKRRKNRKPLLIMNGLFSCQLVFIGIAAPVFL